MASPLVLLQARVALTASTESWGTLIAAISAILAVSRLPSASHSIGPSDLTVGTLSPDTGNTIPTGMHHHLRHRAVGHR